MSESAYEDGAEEFESNETMLERIGTFTGELVTNVVELEFDEGSLKACRFTRETRENVVASLVWLEEIYQRRKKLLFDSILCGAALLFSVRGQKLQAGLCMSAACQLRELLRIEWPEIQTVSLVTAKEDD